MGIFFYPNTYNLLLSTKCLNLMVVCSQQAHFLLNNLQNNSFVINIHIEILGKI